MSDVTWPAWMPEPPTERGCAIGLPSCIECRRKLLAWYAEAKRRDPDFGHVTAPRTPLPANLDVSAAAKRVFPLPEEADDGCA